MALAVLGGPPPAAATSSPGVGEVSVFAVVPHPGHPEGVVVAGDRVHVTTTAWLAGLVVGDGTPSRIFTFDRRTGDLVDELVVEGEDTSTFHGVGGIVVDGHGNRYATVNPYPHPQTGRTGAAVVRFGTDGSQVAHGLIPDLPPCTPLSARPCSPTPDDRTPLANDLVFDRAGNLYVSDSFQATVWRIPPAGGVAEPWLQSADLDGLLVGPNGVRVSPDGAELWLAVMAHRGTEGTIRRIPLVERPDPSDVVVHHRFDGESPDGFTFGTSGRLYVVLGEGAVVALAPDGREVARWTSELFHGPASPYFDDATRSLLVTNHAFDDPDPSHQTVVRVAVDDTGLPLARPCFDGPVVRDCRGHDRPGHRGRGPTA